MPEFIVDLHVHSKYSRACSKALELPAIAKACEQKGISIIVTGDFTHPRWFEHLTDTLTEDRSGVYRLKNNASPTRFVIGTEVACIYKHAGAVRRVHLLLFAPTLEVAGNINQALAERGCNLKADGRPILGISAKDLLKLMLAIDERCVMIPAHAWTPWFAVFGSKSGYNSLEECFEELTPHIRAIETGLSSDPVMNRRLSMLDGITLISNSDAHSLENLAREASVFTFDRAEDITYDSLFAAIQTGDKKRFAYTIEFYPEEGKYHTDGHAACLVSLEPAETKRENGLCPKCGKPLTIGVLHRVDDLADRAVKNIPTETFIPHRYIVPLREIIAQVIGVKTASKKVVAEYARLITRVGSEFFILLHAPLEMILKEESVPGIAEAIGRMRAGTVKVTPGYDGIFGVIEVVDKKDSGAKVRQGELLI